MKLSEFRVLTFDCYGTLVDWESGILGALRPWAQRAHIAPDDVELLSAFAEAESTVQAARPGVRYPEILREAHGLIAASFGVAHDERAAEAFGACVGDWPAFPDTRGALERLHRKHQLVVVSNVDRASFTKTQERIGVTFDAIVTAEEVGAYKPDLRMFRRALDVAEGLGASPAQVLHVAQSLFHDHVPAKQLQLTTVWVRRASPRPGFGAAPQPSRPVWPDIVVSTLAELADLEDQQESAAKA
jgi:2-haloacid dehalogenase